MWITLSIIAIFTMAVPGIAESSSVPTQSTIESNVTGQLQYRITIEGDLTIVRPRQDNIDDSHEIIFQRRPVDGLKNLESSNRGEPAKSSANALDYAVAIDGDYAIVGAEWHDDFRGAAYIFKGGEDGWDEPYKLVPPDLGRFDHFGSSVSINGNIAIVGTTWQNLFKGAVYIFKLVDNEWLLQQKLTPAESLLECRFGSDIWIGGQDIIVATNLQESAINQVYAYRQSLDIWTEKQAAADLIIDGISQDLENSPIYTESLADLINAMDMIEDNSSLQLQSSAEALLPPDSVLATDGAYEDRVEVMWSRVNLDAIIYKILRNDTLISIMSSEDSLYADRTSTPGITCNYCIVVADMIGEESEPACDEGSRIIFPPISVAASDGQYDQFVRLTWIDMSFIEAGFSIHRNTEEIAVLDANSTRYYDTTAEAGVSYYYEVIAFDANNNMALPKGDNGFRGNILPPLDVSASDGEYQDSVLVTWTDQAENETGYAIYRNDELLAVTEANKKSYADLTALMGIEYEYCVVTLGTGSIESIPVCDMGGIGILPAPDSVNASDATFDDHIEITWDDPSNLEDGFWIYRDGDSIATTQANVRIYKDFLASPGILHNYCVIAFSNDGGQSASICDNGFQSYVLAPYEVEATDGTFENRVDITWKSNSTTALLFKIFRGDTFIKSVSKDSRSYSDYGGTAGEEYSYKVTAAALGVEATGEPDMGSRELLAPTTVAATDEEYENKIIITWADNSSIEHGYVVKRDGQEIGTTSPNSTSITDITAESGVTYNYSVAAFDNLGEAYGESDWASDDGRRVLLAPSGLLASDGRFENRVELTWADNSSAEDGYMIYRDGDSIGTTPDNFTSYTDLVEVVGQESEYSIRAFDAYGESDPASDPGFATLMAPVSVNASDLYLDKIVLSWVDRSEIETGYEILRDNVPIGTTPSNVNTFTDIPAGVRTPFDYCVRSLRGFGQADPIFEGSCDLDGYAAIAAAVKGDYAYVTDFGASAYDGAFFVVDISDPQNPDLVKTYSLSARAMDIAIRGKYAYVANYGYGLNIFNISNPANPGFAGHITTPNHAFGVALKGDFAYVADYRGGLWVINVSDTANLSEVARYDTPGQARQVAINGDFAYIADETSLQVIDISDPNNPTFAGSYITPDTCRDIAITGNYACLAVDISGLLVIDISDPNNPVRIGSYDTPGKAFGVTLFGDYAYAADGNSGLQVIDISDPENPRLAGSYNTPGSARGTVASGDYAYVADYASGLQVLKIGSSSESVCDAGEYPEYIRRSDTTDLDITLYASDPEAGDKFGASVAVSGNYAIVGSPVNIDSTGSAYILERGADGSWTQKQKLMASDIASGDVFGLSVSISGKYAIVGSPFNHGANALYLGSAYIFERAADGKWLQKNKLLPTDDNSGSHFGKSVAISGDYAIVGANFDDENGLDAGAAYVFERDANGNWSQINKLLAADGAPEDYFGYRVAISGDYAIVGSPDDDDKGTLSGSAYIFERGANGKWLQINKLLASDGQANDRLGSSVAISGDIAVVGAPHADNTSGVNAGTVYVYQRSDTGWTEVTRLSGWSGSQHGSSVGISGDKIIVGRPYFNGEKGSAFIYDRANAYAWNWLRTVNLDYGGRFGSSVGISGDAAIIGAPYDDYHADSITTAGAVYILSSTVNATDGTPNSRVRVTWHDLWSNETKFMIYRDGEYQGEVAADIVVWEDFGALPGRAYEYCVEAILPNNTTERLCDFGCRPPNGNITGNISTMAGAGVEEVSVALTPQPNRSLLFDGVAGHVRIPDHDGTLKFGGTTSYTIEGWIRYSENDYRWILTKGTTQQFPFRLRQALGRLRFDIGDGNIITVTSEQSDLNDDKWHHFACVHDADNDEIRLYIDSFPAASANYTELGNTANEYDIKLGSTQFKGQLDEIRIWNCARTESQIKATMHRLLTGDEPGLIGYWPLDEGGGTVISDESGGNLYGVIENGVYWTEDTPPLIISTPTDMEGNYVVEKIRYASNSTDETSFEVRPFLGQRQFTPAFKKITLSGEHPVENQLNFIETTAFTVSGTIKFAGTGCPVPNAEIRVDGEFRGATDKNGKFSVSVNNDVHKIEPFIDKHTIAPVSITQLFEDNTSGINFTDLTTRTLAGNVGGGCGRYVGVVTIRIRSENNCLDTTLTTDSAYSIILPPQKYMVRANVDESTIPAGLIGSDVVNFFTALGTREINLADVDESLNFVYRAPLQVTIKGLESWESDCQLAFEGRILPEALPVIPQLTVIDLTIEVNEFYGNDVMGNPSYCPLDSGTIRIYDEIFDIEDSLIELEVVNGEATYTTFACTPSLVVGRVDQQGNDRSFQKALRATVYVPGRQPITATEWVLVTGHVAPEGADFITGTAQMPIYILRDPPGDYSYSFLDSNSTIRRNIQYNMDEISGETGLKIETYTGVRIKTFVGFGAGLIEDYDFTSQTTTEFMLGGMTNTENRTDLTTTMRKRFSTSADELFVGEGGDVFIGMGSNYIFSSVGVVEVDYENCLVNRRTAFGFEPESIETIYSYTHQYIEDVLIPNFSTKIDYFDSLYPPDPLVGPDGETLHSDSSWIFVIDRDFWQDILAENDSLKINAKYLENRSFSAGADYSYYLDSMTTKSYTRIQTFTFDAKTDFLGFGIKTSHGGIACSFPVHVNYEYVTDYDETVASTSQAVGYVLGDNNIGDHYTVDIKADANYAGPVFDVLAGVSSCPWEPWPDLETGEPRMMYRDKPQLYMDTPEEDLKNIQPDEVAVINLTLANLSPTEDTRIYVLREVSTSNPGGAVISANGVWLYEGLTYYVNGDPSNNSQQITMTVGRGPTRYYYDSLAVMVYPQCEWDIWQRRTGGPLNHADTLYFDVSFYAPCSDIRLMRPEPGWVFNKANEDSAKSLKMWLTNYELEISDSVAVHYVGVQYRRLGTGPEGPSEWVDVWADSLGGVQTDIDWFPDDTLADGVYELRAFTDCNGDNNGGRGFSSISTGTIDRHAPLVFGKPQPADNILSLGEDIGITFNEPIDCRSVLTDSITLVYLDGPNTGGTIPVDIVCSGKSIIITPDPDSVTAADLEDRVLEATVRGVRDKANNPMEAAETWAFLVKQSVFTWRQEYLICDVAFRDPGIITAGLVNGGDSAVVFEITNLPSWITEIVYASDMLPPGGKQTISFTIQEDIGLGSYEHEVTASCATGITYLNILLTVSCHEPVWAFDRRMYEHTMTIVAQVDIDGTLSADPEDRIAAFVGNQLRGVANLEQIMGSYMAFLTVYSNRSSGETMRFQVWDDDNCKLFNSTLERFAFVTDGRVGSPGYPVTLSATDVLPDTVQVIPLTRGWNWFSTHVQAIDMSVNGVLSYLTPATGDIIKSQTAFAEFDPDMGWVGTLQLLDNVSGYMAKLSEPGTIFQEGSIVDPLTTPIPVADGWNWVSYLPDTVLSIATALQGLNSIAANGDMVKSQTAFSQCFKSGNTISWYGDLDFMEPDRGYKLYLANGSRLKDGFIYPGFGGTPAPLLAANSEQNANGVMISEEALPGWSIDRSDYQYNMTLTAILNVVDAECRDANTLIGAFVDGQCRGMTRPVYLAGLDRYLAFIMIHSNNVAGETVDFQAFVPDAGAVYDIAEKVSYEADAALATVRSPLVLNADKIAYEIKDILPETFRLSQNYPNPFNPITVIEYSLPEQSHVKIEVFNILGQKVKKLIDEPSSAGYYRIEWDGTDSDGKQVSTGIYFYRMQAGDSIKTKKMMILK